MLTRPDKSCRNTVMQNESDERRLLQVKVERTHDSDEVPAK